MRAKSLVLTAVVIGSMAFSIACTTKKTAPAPVADTTSEFKDAASNEQVVETPVANLEVVYFDYDSAVIRDDQRGTISSNANVIKNGKYARLTLAGHCDERGSEEYNLALGERRANSVKQYLTDSGINGSSLETVSFGESQPAVQGHDESAWRMNRRVEFLQQH
jgi:peptidoglycan-associated lipoprotein